MPSSSPSESPEPSASWCPPLHDQDYTAGHSEEEEDEREGEGERGGGQASGEGQLHDCVSSLSSTELAMATNSLLPQRAVGQLLLVDLGCMSVREEATRWTPPPSAAHPSSQQNGVLAI